MGSFCWVLARFFNLLKYLLYVAILSLLQRWNLRHYVFKHIADQHFGISITLHTLINFNFYHFTYFISYLKLLASKTVDLISNAVCYLRQLCSQINFLLSSCKFFLSNPAVYASDLCIKVWLKLLHIRFFALKLLSDIWINLIISVSQFI